MTGQLFSVMITLLCMGSLLTTITWYLADSNYAELSVPLPQKREKPGQLCKQCKKVFDKVKQLYNKTWQKNEENYQKFRTQLSANCSGFDTAIITQINTPRGAQLDYGDKRIQTVTIDLFHRLIKEHPFLNKTWDTCSVVGNGGILANSRCGEMIDSAELVIRCNLAPLSSRYEKHVGSKTYLVTMNPSILREKYNLLNDHRRPFVEKLHNYGSVLLLLPVSPTSMKVLYTLEDFEMPTRVVYYNPTYLHKLAIFWRSHGLKSQRVSTGLIMSMPKCQVKFQFSSASSAEDFVDYKGSIFLQIFQSPQFNNLQSQAVTRLDFDCDYSWLRSSQNGDGGFFSTVAMAM
ncbi:alpha-2,8-sialyltransferase 8F-like [Pholidichthys leucotaenia]